MFDKNIVERIVKKLKQTNVSVDSEKTKKRVSELWKAASKAQKHAIEELAGISRATIYRVYNTGNLSAKLAVPMAREFNVDPYYLIGKANTPKECTEELLVKFLVELGYGKLLEKEKKAELIKPAETANISPEDLTLADLHLLMQSLLLREKAGVEDAVLKAAKLRALLLS